MYNIAKLQATIAKNSFLPNIVVTEKQKTDSKTENVIETNICYKIKVISLVYLEDNYNTIRGICR